MQPWSSSLKLCHAKIVKECLFEQKPVQWLDQEEEVDSEDERNAKAETTKLRWESSIWEGNSPRQEIDQLLCVPAQHGQGDLHEDDAGLADSEGPPAC